MLKTPPQVQGPDEGAQRKAALRRIVAARAESRTKGLVTVAPLLRTRWNLNAMLNPDRPNKPSPEQLAAAVLAEAGTLTERIDALGPALRLIPVEDLTALKSRYPIVAFLARLANRDAAA